MRLLSELPRQRTPWQARLLALVLGVAGPVALALAVRTPAGRAAPDEQARPERVVSLALPATAPVDEGTTPLRAAGPGAPTSPARDRATPGIWAGPAPASPARGDSSGTPDSAAPSPARVPGAREIFRGPASGRPLCLPPCGGGGPTIATGARGAAGAGVLFPPMTKEERDSIAHAVIAGAAAAGGGSSNPAANLPAGVVGVSIPVGLPGGGPTRAQRERARVLDADVSARLARIRARIDSLAELRRRDSVARAVPRPERTETASEPNAG